MRRYALVAAVVCALSAPGAAGAAGTPTTPIRHVISILQENHTYDNYFGTYPHGDGLPGRVCMPVDPKRPKGACVKPFHIGDNDVLPSDLDHSSATAKLQYAGGRLNGFIHALNLRNQDGRLAMGYRDGRDLPYYWNLADEYVLFDRFFSSTAAGSFLNHVYWVAASGGAGYDRSPPGGLGKLPTIFDRLEERGVSWKFYVQNYEPQLTFRTMSKFPGNRAAQVVWVPLLNYARYVDNPRLFRHIVPLDQYFDDLRRGTLPAVSYIAPSGPSEHPPSNLESGQAFVRTLVNALIESPAWPSAAFLLAYDDWGGWYDHVRPPQVDEHGYGFRVPALLISPYAKRGVVNHTQLDFTSLLKFIEQNWRLRPLTARDRAANSIASGLDFTQPAREPAFTSPRRGPIAEAHVRIWVIYLLYGSALLLPAIFIGYAVWTRSRRLRAAAPAVLGLVAALMLAGPAGAATPKPGGTHTLTVAAVPALPGVRLRIAGRTLVTDRRGIARVVLPEGAYRLEARAPREVADGMRARFSRWGDDSFQPGRAVELKSDKQLQVGFEVEYLVRLHFVDLHGGAVDLARIDSITTASSIGVRDKFHVGESRWMLGGRVARRANGLEETQIQYALQRVSVDGANVVHRAQQRFYPSRERSPRIKLLLYSARFSAHDLLFGRPVASAILLSYPDGRVVRYRLPRDGELVLPALARGTYHVKPLAPGYAPEVPVAVSKNQIVGLRVVSYLDLLVFAGGLGSVAIGLVLVRRPLLRSRLRTGFGRLRRPGPAVRLSALLALALLTAAVAPRGAAAAPKPVAVDRPVPVLAYYYIWFDPSSWRRAKTDYPELGRYSSDDVSVLRQHVASARAAGIDGFIVSWKSTPTLNRRLAKLVAVADAAGFKLAVIYQGLDFWRRPLPASRIDADLGLFERRFARDPAFSLFGKPLVVWSGTWRFSRSEIASVARRHRDRLSILASERSVAGYQRVAAAVDGDAYYWSSVDPNRFPGYGRKLQEMAAAVHARGQLWIAPAAPGFDARQLGGKRAVDRKDGATLRHELDAAQQSSPDAIGLISWNEFSENSYVEPSKRYGTRYLDVLSDALRASPGARSDFSSDEPPADQIGYGLPFVSGLGFVIVSAAFLRFWRREVRRAR
jgi:phospholipase C